MKPIGSGYPHLDAMPYRLDPSYFFQRARAAVAAICFRRRGERLLARAAPPFRPPFRPISARYFCIGVRSSFSVGSSVERRTISAARSIGSVGSFLERIILVFLRGATSFYAPLFARRVILANARLRSDGVPFILTPTAFLNPSGVHISSLV